MTIRGFAILPSVPPLPSFSERDSRISSPSEGNERSLKLKQHKRCFCNPGVSEKRCSADLPFWHRTGTGDRLGQNVLWPHEPGKDGKGHLYWSLVETASGRAGFESLFDARGQQITYTDAGDAR